MGWRLLTQRPARMVASVAGVGLSLMLILLLGALSVGVDRRVTVFEDRSGADLFVAQPGTTSFLGGFSSLPADTTAKVEALPSVRWAVPVRGFFTVPERGGVRVPTYVVGAAPGGPGAPWALGSGRAPTAPDEVAIGHQLADRLDVGVGDPIDLVGRPLRVVGIADDADMFMASFAFVTHDGADALAGGSGTTSFVLVGSDDPAAAAGELQDAGLHSLSVEEVRRNDLALKGKAYSAALGLLWGVAFGVGAVVIALTAYSIVLDSRRDYGVLKAVGATRATLRRVVLTQTCVLALAGVIAGGAFAAVAIRLVTAARPQLALVVTPGAMTQVVVATAAMAIVGAWLPSRRLEAMDPSAAFGGA